MGAGRERQDIWRGRLRGRRTRFGTALGLTGLLALLLSISPGLALGQSSRHAAHHASTSRPRRREINKTGLPNPPSWVVHRHLLEKINFDRKAPPKAPGHRGPTVSHGNLVGTSAPRIRTLWASCEPASCGTPPAVNFQEGPIQIHPHIYLIFWGSNWNTYDTGIKSALERFYTGMGPAGTLSEYSGLLTQYCSYRPGTEEKVCPAQSGATISANFTVTSIDHPSNVGDTVIGNELRALTAPGSAWAGAQNDPEAQFIVLPARGTTYISSFAPGACGFHSQFGAATYTWVPDMGDPASPYRYSETGCGKPGDTSAAQAETGAASHEYAETVTDPRQSAWESYGRNGHNEPQEIADLCNQRDLEYHGTGIWVDGLWDDHKSTCEIYDLHPGDAFDPPPLVNTEAANELTETAATLHGSVNPNHGATSYYFEYGTTPAYGSVLPPAPGWSIGSGHKLIYCFNRITGLLPGTEYHYRIVAENPEGRTLGADHVFTTVEQPNVFFSDKEDNGEISDWTWNESTGWQMQSFFRDEVAPGTSPAALTVNGTRNVFFSDKNDNGEISDWTWSWTKGWQMQALFQDKVVPGTSPAAVMINGAPNVFFSDKEDNGALSDWTWSSSEGWHLVRLFRDSVAPGTSPTAVVASGKAYVFFSDREDNGELSVWTWTAGEGWKMQSLFRDAVAAGTSPSAVVVNGAPQVFFSDKEDNGEISDWTWSAEGWKMQSFFQDEAALGTSPSAVVVNGSPHVFFSDKNDNGEISDWFWEPKSGWLLARFFQDEAVPGTSPSALIWNGGPHVFFSDKSTNGEISDWTVNSTEGWHLIRLFKDAVAAGSSPSAIMGQ
jgi:hypothetical protein